MSPPNHSMTMEKCPHHSGLDQQLEEHERRLEANDRLIQKIFDKLDQISGKLLGKPGWSVCIIVSLLMAALASCITIIVTLMRIANNR